jgi:hypothetical protein
MTSRIHAIQAFWNWFQEHLTDFDAMRDSDEPFWDVALSELQRVDKRLRFELSKPDGGARDYVVTAEGHIESFSAADALVAHAPLIPGWQFTALKPPMGFDFVTTYEGIRFDPATMWFRPLVSGSRPQDLGISIGVPDLTAAIQRQADNAILVILDTALGERAAALDIQHVEVSILPESPEAKGYIELHELPHYIDFQKRKHWSH